MKLNTYLLPLMVFVLLWAGGCTPAPTGEPVIDETNPQPGNVQDDSPADASAGEGRQVTFVLVPEETQASYTIDEVLFSENNRINTAVGVTSAVEGRFTLNYDDPSVSEFGEFVVDISTLQSDEPERDSAIRTRWLVSGRFPLATYVVTEVRDFPPDPQEGERIQFQLAGDMTVKETTRQVVWDVAAELNRDRLTGTATTSVLLKDFDIPIPGILGILRVTDGVTLTLDFTFQAVQE